MLNSCTMDVYATKPMYSYSKMGVTIPVTEILIPITQSILLGIRCLE